MKKLFALLAALALLLGLGACVGGGQDNPTTAPETTPSQTTTTGPKLTTQGTTHKPSPPTGLEHSSGAVDLLDNNYYESIDNRSYRLAYYRIPGVIGDLVSEDKYTVWAQQNFWGKTVFTEMPLVTFVKHFDISREAFDTAIAELAITNAIHGNNDEEFEVPNADVIYTFDNEIINRYYRYE